MKQISILILTFFFTATALGQVKDIIISDGFTSPIHNENVGRITFMSGNIPLEKYTAADFLETFELARKSDLNIRVFMDNSITNYLHQLAPEVLPELLLKNGNFQFSFMVDGKHIYTENINTGCTFGSTVNKASATTFRVPLTSTKGEDWWAMYMFDRFRLNGGNQVLTEGSHNLKIELRAYINDNNKIKVSKLIAEGQLKLIIKTPVATPEQIAIQTIKPGSDWKTSSFSYEKEKLEALNKAIANDDLKDITSVVVIKDGELLIEEYFNGADRTTLHDTRSAGKSFTSTLMGMAIKDGYIKNEAQPLSTFYDLKKFANYTTVKENIKIKDLLTMSSAFDGNDAKDDSPGNEENMYDKENWVKFVLDLPTDKTKTNGSRWDYFTAGVVLMGDILNSAVPKDLENYADSKLFKPLNITKYQWQYTPQKVVNTAGSLQMSSLDYAKYAQLYKDNGKWKGKQIIPADWVKKTLTKQIQIPDRENQYYGFLFWNKTFIIDGKSHEAFYCAGNGGNEFIIFNDLPIVIIVTSKAYNKPYAHPQTESIVKDYILPSLLK